MRRCVAVALLAGASLIGLAPEAGAHALLRSSEPAPGEQLANAPDAVTIVFTEVPEASLSSIHVLDTAGTAFERGRPERVPADRRALRVGVRPLPRGVYTVSWRTVSSQDGHATAGSFAFGVGVQATVPTLPPGAVAPRSPPTSGLEVAGRFGLFLGLLGLIGGGWLAAAAFPEPPRAALRLAAWSWVAGAAGLGMLAEAQRRAAGAGLGDLLATPLGRALIWRGAALVAAGAALLVAARARGPERTRARRVSLWVAVAAGVALAYAHVNAGHASAASPRVAEVFAQWLHVVAGSAWVGGLGALLLFLRGAHSSEKVRAVRRFSTVAAFSIAVVAGTGVVRAFGQLHLLSDLWSSGYGEVVLAKSALILVLAGLGAINRYRNVPRAATSFDGLRRVSRVEAGVGIVTLAAASLLASLAPPAPRAEAAPSPRLVATGSDLGTSVKVRLEAIPGTAGPNRFVVRITDYDTGAPVVADRVGLRFTYLDDPRVGQSTLALARAASVYRADGLSLSLAGRWRVAVVIERGIDSLEVPLQIATRCVTRTISGSPTIFVVDLAGAGTAQTYLDPERAGKLEVHVTFFKASGDEQPIAAPPAMRASQGDRLLDLAPRRLDPGHFVASATLVAGDWRFDFAATGDGGRQLRGCFTETVRP